MHPFERAGLGQAPFRCVGVRENVYSSGPGHQQPGGTCAYCANGIKYECVIRSNDGKTFTVGTDCVYKLGRQDNVLVDAAKRARRAVEQEKREAKRRQAQKLREQLREIELQAQRKRNGGMTDYEIDQERKRLEAQARADKAAADNRWITDVLKTMDGRWVGEMYQQLQSMPMSALSDRTIKILRDVYAKSFGRFGSKKYEAACDVFDAKVQGSSHV